MVSPMAGNEEQNLRCSCPSTGHMLHWVLLPLFGSIKNRPIIMCIGPRECLKPPTTFDLPTARSLTSFSSASVRAPNRWRCLSEDITDILDPP